MPEIPLHYISNAITWAKSKLGSTDYRGKCLAFTEDAYEQSNDLEIFGGDSAQESADIYEAGNKELPPPLGAFVFFSCKGEVEGKIMNWGHVGIAIENGEIIHAWDKVRIDSLEAMVELVPPPGWSKLEYLGWSPVERIFQGYIKH
ncbi:MAG: NlpC/P60 family protein [Candidatus Cloacimonetes bacterium]|jgi:cell wall-associated NlpC family hydrolase|nr:C40 family peptidase [Candidatus Cloacimonadota bacterium]MDY0337524.1 NlpC/P60 family protein [Candidatus Cloacimonadaceae bacterium]MCB5269764.1 C40 family peptidase [Candidatus Cloacimonadota bacterium]MCK9333969.1 C40 family peptidase [Candidatus Cloacimonadota bacterium]MDD3097988.1 NlpC/P60 family protein [Candidatus Cloacimonadota bacterium]